MCSSWEPALRGSQSRRVWGAGARHAGRRPRRGGRRLLAGALRPAASAHAADSVLPAGICGFLPGSARWVAKDDMAEYMRLYAQRHGIRPRLRTEVRRLERDGSLWTALTNDGRGDGATRRARDRLQPLPRAAALAGTGGFAGVVIHASEYRSASPVHRPGRARRGGREHRCRDRRRSCGEAAPPRCGWRYGRPRTSSPGSGSGADHAAGDLDGVLACAARRPVNRLLQRSDPRRPDPVRHAGRSRRRRRAGPSHAVTPTIDVGLVESLRAGRVVPVAAVERFDGREVVLVDGTRFAPDAVIAATGYTTGLGPVVGHLGCSMRAESPRDGSAVCCRPHRDCGSSECRTRLKGHLLQIKLDARSTGAGDRQGASRYLRDPGRRARSTCTTTQSTTVSTAHSAHAGGSTR